MERRGIPTEKGDQNRLVAEHNAVVVDLAKAREEWKRLEAERVVSERLSARLKKGWILDHAKALAQLEYYDCGGRYLGRHDVDGLYDESQLQLREVKAATAAIDRDGQRLDQAAQVLQDREKAGAEMKRLENPIAAAKRLFSSMARQGYESTQRPFQAVDNEAQGLGVTSESSLQTQRARWERSRARLPALEEKTRGLTKTLERAALALRGFQLEQEREHEWVYQRRRQRSRDQESGPLSLLR